MALEDSWVVTNNTKQGLIVIGITIVFLLGGLFIRGRRYVLGIAVDDNLKQSYVDLAAHETNAADSQSISLTSTDLWAAFCDTNYGKLKYVSFPPPEYIFLAKEPVKIGSSNFLCVVEKPNSPHGINASGEF